MILFGTYLTALVTQCFYSPELLVCFKLPSISINTFVFDQLMVSLQLAAAIVFQ